MRGGVGVGPPLAELHKWEAWLDYGRALVDRVGLHNTAARCGIDLTDGVATKYLKSYLGRRRTIEREGDNLTPRRSIATTLR